MRILSVFGTRPEAIKMAPVLARLRATHGFQSKVCVTGQHRGMLDQVLRLFGIRPEFDLDIMRPSQGLSEVTSKVLLGLERVVRTWRPDRILVQGDTTSAFAAALGAFYAGIPVAHIEAGLRTGDPTSPWPEEMNRRWVSSVADLHFAPTPEAARNLLREGVPRRRILVTGNTVVDALQEAVRRIRRVPGLEDSLARRFPFLDPARKLILVTGHRRENHGAGILRIGKALLRLSQRKDVQIVFPVHLNPKVRGPIHRLLGKASRVHLLEPLEYLPFLYLMKRSHLVLTDSGGIQEEAPSLGKPVLVMRDTTERPEAVKAGTVKLVGAQEAGILAGTKRLLEDPRLYARMARAHNPYGDGRAAGRIVRALLKA